MIVTAQIRRFVPLAVMLALGFAAIYFDLHRSLTLDALRENRHALQNFVNENRVLSAAAFAAGYALVVALSFPGATILSVTGGFLFGVIVGGALIVLAATIGAILVFLVARSVIGDALRRRAGPFLRRMEDGFRTNAFSYLLFLRLVPAFPFWVVNLVPPLLGVRLSVFGAATAIGIIPGTFVFAAFGSGLGNIFDAGGEIQPADILSPTLLAAFTGLGLLALLPIAFRKLWGRDH